MLDDFCRVTLIADTSVETSGTVCAGERAPATLQYGREATLEGGQPDAISMENSGRKIKCGK